LPLVSEPWFELPIVTEWTKDKANETYAATRIEKYRIDIRDMPSVLNSGMTEIASMNEFDNFISEEKMRAQEEANSRVR
jgi:hypothetical protein